MTESRNIKGALEQKSRVFVGARELIFGFMGVFALALTIRNSDAAGEYIKEGLRLCATTVIPSLFPFMVIANLVSVVNFPTISRVFDRLFKRILGVSGGTMPILLMGNICGFPVGAKLGSLLLKEEKISREELQRSLIFSSNPSAAFVIGVVGGSLFSSREFGVRLYALTLLTSLAVGLLQRIFLGKADSNAHSTERISEIAPRSPKGFATRFTDAVGDSALSVISVCAFVLFFTAFTGILGDLLTNLSVSPALRALIFGFFEMTGGTAESALLSGRYARAAAAFAVGWSGVSVHLQIFSILGQEGIKMKSYLLLKLLQGILTSLLAFFFLG